MWQQPSAHEMRGAAVVTISTEAGSSRSVPLHDSSGLDITQGHAEGTAPPMELGEGVGGYGQ